MAQELERRVSLLEQTLISFIQHTGKSLSKLDSAIMDMRIGMDDFKEEMRLYRENSAKEMKDFKDEMRLYRENSAKEMKDFKNEMAQKWGGLANRLGTFVEDIVIPNIVPIAVNYFNCSETPDDFVTRRVIKHRKEPSRIREYDAYAVYKDTIILSEAKSKPSVQHLKSFSKAIDEFYEYLPEFTDKKIIPIFASLNIEESIVRYATKKRIYVMALKGNLMDILNYQELLDQKIRS